MLQTRPVCTIYNSYKSNIGIIAKMFCFEVMSTLIYSYHSDLVQIHYKHTGMSAISMKFITKVMDASSYR